MPSFDAHVARLDGLLARRTAIVERLEQRLLNVKGKDAARRRDRPFFEAALDAAFGTSGLFPPIQGDRLDAAGLIIRAYDHWDRTRWPGASGRLTYAHTVFDVFLLRQLEDLSLRIWDETPDAAPARLTAIQRLLDAANASSPRALIRDARWLLQTAQGPLARDLAPYFRVAREVAMSFTGRDGLAVHGAGAKLAGGHLRSQWRHRAAERRRPANDLDVLLTTRNSNAMDVGLLVWDLVPLLEAYVAAAGDEETRVALADAIVQGCSADPALLLERLDLLAPYTMIETLFVNAGDDGRVALTDLGAAHVRMLERYADLIGRAAPALALDARRFDPEATSYSPLGITYGFCADLIVNMAGDALHGHAARGVPLEDVFAHGGTAGSRRVEQSPEWAREIFARTSEALERRAAQPERPNASSIMSSAAAAIVVAPAGARANAQDHCVTSDVALALATGATAFPRSQFVLDRTEGRFLASAETDGRWFGLSKSVLTARLARGEDAIVTDVPPAVVEILRITSGTLLRTA